MDDNPVSEERNKEEKEREKGGKRVERPTGARHEFKNNVWSHE